MEGRGIKRNLYGEMKNDLCLELQNLTIDSSKLGNDLHEAIEDFDQLWRCMVDRQADFLSRSLLLEEKYRSAIYVIEQGPKDNGGEGSGENIILPNSYAEDTMKYLNDVKSSLNAHEKLMAEGYQEMEEKMEKYTALFDANMKQLRDMAGKITTQKQKLSSKLFKFNRSMIID